MLEQGGKSPIKVTRSKQAYAKRKFVDDSDSTDPEDDNLLVTPNVPPPAQWIVHPKTGAVYENVTRKVYERSKEEELDWFGWTVPPAQHNKFMAPNETFVVFSRLVVKERWTGIHSLPMRKNLPGLGSSRKLLKGKKSK
jgi:hypothetical protein